MSLLQITPEEAAAELLRRRRAREDGGAYREYVSGLYVAKHSRLIWDKLNTIKPGCGKRYMFFLPPGSGKTLDISHHFPAHYLSRFPEYPIIGTSHTEKFAEQNGRRVRNIILSDEHRTIFPNITVSDESSAAARWELSNGGMYMGFGVGATVVGRRAGGIIMDDVVAGIAAADSDTEREFIWNWWNADLSTRLIPKGWVILVMTRYNLDDIAGRLLAASTQRHGEKWEVISLPALAKENDPLGRKPGDALWPEWQSKADLLAIRGRLNPRMWSALYQQEPVAEQGNLVQRSWIKLWCETQPPKCDMIAQTYDTAISSKDGRAYSVAQTWGIFTDPTGMPAMILLSRWRERVEYPDLRKMAVRLAFNYLDDRRDMPMRNPPKLSPDMILVEDVTVSKGLISDLALAGISVTRFNPQKYGSKEARLRLCLDILENGRVYVPALPPNYTIPRRFAEEWIQSMISWPAGESKDDADAFSQLVLRMKTTGWIRNTEDADVRMPKYTTEVKRGPLYG